VTIVAHSMGGLVARNFVESGSRNGHRFARQLITVGTPHDGAPETYSHFHRKTLPFGWIINGANIAAWLTSGVPILAPVVARAPNLFFPFLMRTDTQVELIRSYAGAIQLLPDTTPFAGVPGSPPEPLTASYIGMNHLKGTGKPVRTVMDLLRNGLQSASALDAFLGSKGVTYHTLASAGRATIDTFEVGALPPSLVIEPFTTCATGSSISGTSAFRNGSVRPIGQRPPVGDGTVPLASAHFLPAGTNIIKPSPLSRVDHGKLFDDLTVRNYCFTQIGVPRVTREMTELAPLGLGQFSYARQEQDEVMQLEAV